MVLLVVIRNNTMRNVTDVLIAHLSLSDTMLIVFSTPALLLQEIGSGSFQPGDIFPKICAGVVIFCSIVSVFTVVAIAIER
jgi:hypothetical protein